MMANKSKKTASLMTLDQVRTEHLRTDVLAKPIIVTHFDTVKAIEADSVVETLADFIARFNILEIKAHTLAEYKHATKEQQKEMKNGRCFSLAEYGDNRNGYKSLRNKHNVKRLSGISIDIDNKIKKSKLTIEQVRAVFKDYFTLIYTTHSSSDNELRLRLVMIFETPIDAAHYARVFDYCAQKLGLAVDSQTKDETRVSFYPSCPHDQIDHYYCEVNDGKWFDISIVPELTTPPSNQTPSSNKPKKAQSGIRCPAVKSINLNRLGLKPAIQSLIRGGYVLSQGETRSEFIYQLIKKLYGLKVTPKNIFYILADTEYEFHERYVSPEAIWRDVQQCIEKIKMAKYGVVPGVGPYYDKPNYQEPKQICRAISKAIRDYLQAYTTENSSVLAIKASAGIGKTEEVIRAMISVVNNGGYVEVYVPSHNLASDIKQRIENKESFTGRVRILYGRESEEAAPGHCIKPGAARGIAKSDIAVSNLLCQDKEGRVFCAAFNECGYRQQYIQPTNIAIYVHQHLFLKRNSVERQKKPALIIIDESFWKAALDSTPIPFASISTLRVPDQIKDALYTDAPYDYLASIQKNPNNYIKKTLAKLKAEQLAIIVIIQTPLTKGSPGTENPARL